MDTVLHEMMFCCNDINDVKRNQCVLKKAVKCIKFRGFINQIHNFLTR